MRRPLAVLLAASLALTGCHGATSAERGGTAAEEKSRHRHGAVRKVELPPGQYGTAQLVGDALFLTVGSLGGPLGTVQRYDLSSGATSTVVSSPDDIASIVANDRWLLWEADKKLWALDLRAGSRSQLAASREMYAPALEGDLAAWQEWKGPHKFDVVLFDLKRRTRTTVGNIVYPGFYGNFMQLRDGRLLWTDIVGGNGRYRLYDVKSGKLVDRAIAGTAYKYPGYAVRSGDRVFSINFRECAEWDWTDQQFGYVSLRDGIFVPVDIGDLDYLQSSGSSLAMIDGSQRLWLRSADDTREAENMTTELGTSFDSLRVCADGTFIAGWSDLPSGRTTLFLIGAP